MGVKSTSRASKHLGSLILNFLHARSHVDFSALPMKSPTTTLANSSFSFTSSPATSPRRNFVPPPPSFHSPQPRNIPVRSHGSDDGHSIRESPTNTTPSRRNRYPPSSSLKHKKTPSIRNPPTSPSPNGRRRSNSSSAPKRPASLKRASTHMTSPSPSPNIRSPSSLSISGPVSPTTPLGRHHRTSSTASSAALALTRSIKARIYGGDANAKGYYDSDESWDDGELDPDSEYALPGWKMEIARRRSEGAGSSDMHPAGWKTAATAIDTPTCQSLGHESNVSPQVSRLLSWAKPPMPTPMTPSPKSRADLGSAWSSTGRGSPVLLSSRPLTRKGGPLMGLARAKESDAQRDLLLPGFSTPPRKAIRLPQLYADSESEERLEEDLRFSPDSPAGLWHKKKGLGTISTKSQTNLLISDPIIGPQLTRASSTPDLTKFCFGNSNPGPAEDHQKVTFFMQKLKVKDGGVLVSTPAESKLVKKPSFSRLLSRTSTDDTPVPSTVATNSLSIRAIRKGLSGDMRKGVQKPTGPHLVSAQSDSEQHSRLGGPSLETRPTTPPPFSDLITMPTPTARQSKAERLLGLSAGAAAAISSTNQPKYTSSSGVELPRTASSLSASNATQPYARVRSPFELLPRSTTPVPRSSWKQTIAAVTIRRESDRTELQGSRKRVPVLRYDPMRRPKDGFYHGSVSPPQSVGHPWYPGGELGSESDSTSSHHKSSESSHVAAEDVTLSVLINKSRGALTRKLSGTVNLVTRRQQKPTEGRCQQSTGIVMAPPLSQNFSRRWAISPLPHPTYDLPAVPVQHPPPPIEKDPWLLQPCSSTPCVAVLPSRYKPVEAAQVPRYSFAFLAADSRRGSCDYRSDARASSPELDRAVYI